MKLDLIVQSQVELLVVRRPNKCLHFLLACVTNLGTCRNLYEVFFGFSKALPGTYEPAVVYLKFFSSFLVVVTALLCPS